MSDLAKMTLNELVRINNELITQVDGFPPVGPKTFSTKAQFIARIEEIRQKLGQGIEGVSKEATETPEGLGSAPADIKTKKPSKLTIIRDLLLSKGQVHIDELIAASGHDRKNVHATVGVLRNPKKTKDPLDVQYDRETKIFSLIKP